MEETQLQEFLSGMQDHLQACLEFEDNFQLRITFSHPTTEDPNQQVNSVLSFCDGEDAPIIKQLVTLLNINEIIDILTSVSTAIPDKVFNPYDFNRFIGTISDICEGMQDHDWLNDVVSKMYKNATYEGLISQCTVNIRREESVEMTLVTNVHANIDASAVEEEIARQMGVLDTFAPSAPERIMEISNTSIFTLNPFKV